MAFAIPTKHRAPEQVLESHGTRRDFSNASGARLTAAMVDEAVERVTAAEGLQGHQAQRFRSAMADPRSKLSEMYFSQRYDGSAAMKLAPCSRPKLTIPYVLTESQVAELVKYAPDYQLVFTPYVNHDHPMAAACRKIDHVLAVSQIPSAMPVVDVGGNPRYHIESGHQLVHCCNPVEDDKDPTRHVERNMRIRKLARTSKDPIVQQLAQRFCDGDTAISCNKRAQDCEHTAPAITAIHVYDIPIEEWPEIMEKKKANVVEGVMLFSQKFFDSTTGSLSVAGARYHIDPAADEFKLGFEDSPSWWYTHSWSRFMRYGTDQILQHKSGIYSYQINQRRGDTIMFRILRMSKEARPNLSPYYSVPSVPMVEVQGFELGKHNESKSLQPRTYLFPQPLWEDMRRQAALDYEKNNLDYGRLFNYYRTIAPRKTINAHVVMGGYVVDTEKLPALVIHAALAAIAQSMLAAKTTRALTGAELQRRNADFSNAKKLFSRFVSSCRSTVEAYLVPFTGMLDRMMEKYQSDLGASVLSWAPVDHLREINAMHLLQKGLLKNLKRVADHDTTIATRQRREHYVARQAASLFKMGLRSERIAQLLLDVGHYMNDEQRRQLMDAVLDKPTHDAPPTYRTEPSVASEDDAQQHRRAAVLEAIQETEMEMRKTLEGAQKAWQMCTVAGIPNKAKIAMHRTTESNPDFWHVADGLIGESILGVPAGDFEHAAVYSPVKSTDGEYVRSVELDERVGSDGHRRKHWRLFNSTFTGWVMTYDPFVVFNGPEILTSLRLALEKPMTYRITGVLGPPGCRKTTQVIEEYVDGDIVMCPVRESIGDTRSRLAQRLGCEASRLTHCVRTLDSYLVNCRRGTTKALRTTKVLADECFITHAGKWYAALALLGAESAVCFGDEQQLLHIPRVQSPAQYTRIQFSDTRDVHITWRCPKDAVLSFSDLYDFKIRSASNIDRSLTVVHDSKSLIVDDDTTLLGMYQADKKAIRALFPSLPKGKTGFERVMTAHEAQGKTFKKVVLFRFDARPHTQVGTSLYESQRHVLVAMSRHTHTFTYFCPNGISDAVTRRVSLAANYRECQLVGDISTAGKSFRSM